MYFLIAGYNTLTDKKKATYDIKGISRVFGNSFIIMGFLMILGYLISKWLRNPDFEEWVFMCSLIIGLPYLLIKINSEKYRRRDVNK